MSHPLEKHLEYAKEQLEIGNYGRVERAADELMNTTDSPFVKEGLLFKGLAVLSQTRQAQALEYFDKAIADYPTYDLPYFYKCEILMGQGQLEQAREIASALCATDEGNSEYLNILVTIDEYLENYESILSICDKVLEAEPNNFNFLLAKASAKNSLEKYQDAIDTYLLADQVEGIDGIEKAHIYYYIGAAYQQLNELEQAKTYLEKSLSYDYPHQDAESTLESVLDQLD